MRLTRPALICAATVALLGLASPARSAPNPLRTYAADTWRSMAAMTDAGTGLPADKITGDLKTPAKVTSPTDIGAYLWSTISARDLGLISAHDAEGRVA